MRFEETKKLNIGRTFFALGREYRLTAPVTVEVKSDVGDSGGYVADFVEGSSLKLRGIFGGPHSRADGAIDELLAGTMSRNPVVLPARLA